MRFRGKEYVDVGLLGCSAVWTCTNVSEEYTASIFLALKIEAVCPSKTLVSTYKSTRRYNPENKHTQFSGTIS
jgi:hypothetical protein